MPMLLPEDIGRLGPKLPRSGVMSNTEVALDLDCFSENLRLRTF
jgi:hypothetical protein